MSVIKINTFGGIMPSVEPRNLPSEAAQTANNLDMRFGDFRPMKNIGASVASVTTGTKSIFRTPSGVWLSSTNDVDYVNGQINDAASERVYLTGRSAYPEAWESAAYRRLGVPASTLAPTVAATVVDEFSQEDWDISANSIVDTVVAAAVANTSPIILGVGTPVTGGTLGGIWLTPSAWPALANIPAGGVGWESSIGYIVPITSPSPLTFTNASDAYLANPSLGGQVVSYGGGTDNYWFVGGPWQIKGYQTNVPALAAAIELIQKPPENVVQLFDTATALEIAQKIADLFDSGKDPVKLYLSDLNARQVAVVNQILRTDTDDSGRAYALSTAYNRLTESISAGEQYFSSIEAAKRTYVASILNAYRGLLPTAVDIVLESRFYVFTYVTDWGEESAPSPVSEMVELDQNDSTTVTIPALATAVPLYAAPPYGPITHWRLYRSSTSNTGAAYQLVPYPNPDTEKGFPIATLTVADTNLQEELQEVCPTFTWMEPPADLKGLIGLPNGIMAGFFGKTVCFAEPFHPYAWPAEYQLTVEYNIVGFGVFGQTLIVLTEGNPYFVSGADSASMSAQKMESTQACMSKRSIASVEGGVIYASPDGIAIATPTGVEIATLGAFSKDDWQALVLENSFAAFSEGVYYIMTGV